MHCFHVSLLFSFAVSGVFGIIPIVIPTPSGRVTTPLSTATTSRVTSGCRSTAVPFSASCSRATNGTSTNCATYYGPSSTCGAGNQTLNTAHAIKIALPTQGGPESIPTGSAHSKNTSTAPATSASKGSVSGPTRRNVPGPININISLTPEFQQQTMQLASSFCPRQREQRTTGISSIRCHLPQSARGAFTKRLEHELSEGLDLNGLLSLQRAQSTETIAAYLAFQIISTSFVDTYYELSGGQFDSFGADSAKNHYVSGSPVNVNSAIVTQLPKASAPRAPFYYDGFGITCQNQTQFNSNNLDTAMEHFCGNMTSAGLAVGPDGTNKAWNDGEYGMTFKNIGATPHDTSAHFNMKYVKEACTVPGKSPEFQNMMWCRNTFYSYIATCSYTISGNDRATTELVGYSPCVEWSIRAVGSGPVSGTGSGYVSSPIST